VNKREELLDAVVKESRRIKSLSDDEKVDELAMDIRMAVVDLRYTPEEMPAHIYVRAYEILANEMRIEASQTN
jgi:hypothetical protein